MKKNHLKTLLIAIMVLAGANAYAQDVYTSVYSRTLSDWTTADVTAWGGNANLTVDPTYGLGFNPTQPSTAYTATQSFAIDNNSKIKYVVTWRTGNSTGRTNNYEYIQFGDKVRISYNSSYNYYLNTDGTSSATSPIVYNKNVANNAITIIFNTATKSVESFTFNGTPLTTMVTGTLDGNFNNISFGFVRGGSTSSWAYPNYLTAIDVSECTQAVTSKDYTINYQLNGTTISSSTGTLAVGAIIAAVPAITANGTKYITVENPAPSMIISETADNILTVPVRLPYTATLNVTTMLNETPTTVTKNLVESDLHDASWSYAYPLYLKSGDVYYKVDNTSMFGESGTFTDGEVINRTVSYSTPDADVVFYADASTTPGTNYTYSNGESGVVLAQNARDRGISAGSLVAGNYEYIVNFTAINRRSLVLRSGTNDPIVSLSSSTTGETSTKFSLLNDTTNLYINGANSSTSKTNQSEDFDYVIVKKAPALTININATSNLASYSNSQPVTVPDDLTIYIATATDAINGISLTKLAGKVIPANTGVLLYSATTGDKTLIYTGTSTDDFSTNILKATNDGTYTSTGSEYALIKGEPNFAQVQSGIVIPSNKAYVTIPGAGAKLSINFDQATSIINLNTGVGADSATSYNLSGQKVNASYKGIIIKNGKKYIAR